MRRTCLLKGSQVDDTPYQRGGRSFTEVRRTFLQTMGRIIRSWLITVIWIYFLLLFGWLGAYLLTGDRFAFLSALNMLAVYLFYPLPLVIIAAIFLRRRELWAGVLFGVVLFARLWGGLFLPNFGQPENNPDPNPTIKVMTYNVLGYHTFTSPVIGTIRSERPDLVLLQELNPQLAAATQRELIAEYPYQILNPATGVSGMGVISKYPIQPSGESIPLKWVGEPQVLILDLNGKIIKVINFHMVPTTTFNAEGISRINMLRKAQAQALLNFVNSADPLIVAGDANATPLSEVHKLLIRDLADAWQEAGFGLEHTLPGSDISGSSRPHIAGRPVPMWLARIDYIFHSPDWNTLDARLAKFDGVSDHRGVVAVMSLENLSLDK